MRHHAGGAEVSPVNPHDDCPSTETEKCDLGRCSQDWAIEVDRDNGPRPLRLCEGHAEAWLAAEREFMAEREERAGRGIGYAALFGLARAGFVDGYAKKVKRSA